MNKFISIIVLILIQFLIDSQGEKFSSKAVARERLIQDLFTNYDRNVRPTGEGVPTNLEISLKIIHFRFNEKDGTFKFTAELKVAWIDPKIEWIPKDYNNIELIRVKNMVWSPDLEIYNNKASEFLIMNTRGYTWIHSTGSVTWKDQIHTQVLCPLDMKYWPNDQHNCSLKVGSWTHHGLDIDLHFADLDKPIEFHESMGTSEYEVVNFSAIRNVTYHACCDEPYITLVYSIEFKRRSSAFTIIFHIPALCVALLTLSVFLLDPCRGEKIILNGISLIMIVGNLIYFAKNIASFSNSIPKIVIYYTLCFVMVTISMVISCLSLAATRSMYRGKLPSSLVKLLKSQLGFYFGPKNIHTTYREHVRFDDVKLEENQKNSTNSNRLLSLDEWTCLAVVVERATFAAFGCIFLLLSLYVFLV